VLQTTSAILYSLGSLVMPIIAEATSVAAVLIGCVVLTGIGVTVALLLAEAGPTPIPIDSDRARLLEHPMFAGLPVPRLEAAARALEPVPVTAGQVVVRQNDPADRFYVIADGAARVTQVADGGPEVELRTLGPGDIFGEIGLLRHSPRTATVTATRDGTFLALGEAEFRELVGSGPGLSSRLLDLYRGALAR
jgi:hypothetical protein